MKPAQTHCESQSDVMDLARANALLAALGRGVLSKGSPLPPFFHHLYFWSPKPPKALGRDGHPALGGLVPDLGLPRRMWAGGHLQFHAPLHSGRNATRESRLESVVQKEGQSGPLAFVSLRHEILQGGELCISERQDLVYREDPSQTLKSPKVQIAPLDSDAVQPAEFDSTLLFRYSALTFNGHRIHYDFEYARDVEGYAGLVVHGPLLAQLLMLFAAEKLGSLATFEFRATAPLMHFERAELRCKGSEFWVAGPDNRLCMRATAAASPSE